MPGPGSVDRYLVDTTVSSTRVTFHNATVQPLVDEFGHDVQPKTSTNFALHTVSCETEHNLIIYDLSTSPEQVKFARQEYPYDTDCYPSWSSTNYTEKFLTSTLWPYTFMVLSN